MADINLEKKLKADEEGNLLVLCPKCDKEFRTPIGNIIAGNLKLQEEINCPLCNAKLEQVYPDKKTIEEATNEIKEKVLDGFDVKF